MSATHLTNIAIVGAGGNVGSHITRALLATGKHSVTAITRAGSTGDLPAGLAAVKTINYDDPTTLVAALQGQQVLINTISASASEAQEKLVDAAAAAGVQWIVPNEWASDYTNVALGEAIMLGPSALAMRRYIESKGLKWIAVSCSFWYEYSLAGTEGRYGFDFAEKKLTLFGDGSTKISTTTWPQVGRAVAGLLSLPVDGASPCVRDWANDAVLIESFALSQRDMLASVLRVTGDKESDWTISHEGTKERYARGTKMLGEGNMIGFLISMYTGAFIEENPAYHGDKVVNEKLTLPKEDLDKATKEAVRMAKATEA